MLFFSPTLHLARAHFLKSSSSASWLAFNNKRHIPFAEKLVKVKLTNAELKMRRMDSLNQNTTQDSQKMISMKDKIVKYHEIEKNISLLKKIKCIDIQNVFEPGYTQMDKNDSPPLPYVSQVNLNTHFPPRSYRSCCGKWIALSGKENLI
ncbi:hypothetical protein [Erwinia tasmaniensis]|uniref:hypothetical protein n=1 Tax=Erwinia tasmaniensis TaxID=338565 RepID=UPI0005B5304E|nr:hypothetical protein [Erwinia tasmaniensis]